MKLNLDFACLVGSTAYGLNTPQSDVDIKGITVPPQEVTNNIFTEFNQTSSYPEWEPIFEKYRNPINPKLEYEVYSLKKYITLAADCNPNIVELLFIEPQSIIVMSDKIKPLFENKHLFLSKKAKFTFTGYSVAQLERIERHRKWRLEGELKKPERKDFGLDDIKYINMDELYKVLQTHINKWYFNSYNIPGDMQYELLNAVWESIYYLNNTIITRGNWIDYYENAALEKIKNDLNLKEEVMDILKRENEYRKADKHYKLWVDWKNNRNKHRSELETKFGFDTKHAMHLIRLLLTCKEILSTNNLSVLRPEKDFLMDIRNGKYSYDEIMQFSKNLHDECEELYKTSTLPKTPDRNKINQLYNNLIK